MHGNVYTEPLSREECPLAHTGTGTLMEAESIGLVQKDIQPFQLGQDSAVGLISRYCMHLCFVCCFLPIQMIHVERLFLVRYGLCFLNNNYFVWFKK